MTTWAVAVFITVLSLSKAIAIEFEALCFLAITCHFPCYISRLRLPFLDFLGNFYFFILLLWDNFLILFFCLLLIFLLYLNFLNHLYCFFHHFRWWISFRLKLARIFIYFICLICFLEPEHHWNLLMTFLVNLLNQGLLFVDAKRCINHCEITMRGTELEWLFDSLQDWG